MVSLPLCNGYKGVQTHHVDPETGKNVPLFNPRQHQWEHHFQWSDNGVHIIGKTTCGRATIVALKLNNEFLTRARRRWAMADGWLASTEHTWLRYRASGHGEYLSAEAVQALRQSLTADGTIQDRGQRTLRVEVNASNVKNVQALFDLMLKAIE